MSTSASRALIPIAEFDLLRAGRAIVRQEAQALEQVAQQLDAAFCAAVELILDCRGSVIVAGMGKAGLIGQKLAATLSSTGTRAHVLHPAEALHGDLVSPVPPFGMRRRQPGAQHDRPRRPRRA